MCAANSCALITERKDGSVEVSVVKHETRTETELSRGDTWKHPELNSVSPQWLLLVVDQHLQKQNPIHQQ